MGRGPPSGPFLRLILSILLTRELSAEAKSACPVSASPLHQKALRAVAESDTQGYDFFYMAVVIVPKLNAEGRSSSRPAIDPEENK
jgi:hypothetical protein